MASWLVRSTPDRAVRALAGDFALSSWEKHPGAFMGNDEFNAKPDRFAMD